MSFTFKETTEFKTSPSGSRNKLCKVTDCKLLARAEKNDLCCTHYKLVNKLCTSKCMNKALDDGSGKCENIMEMKN
jgi:hypothetical protein